MPRSLFTARKSTGGRLLRSTGVIAATATEDQPTGGGDQRPRLVAAAGFIDIGNSVVVAPEAEEQCIACAVRLLPMLQHARNAKAALEATPAGTNVAMPCGPIALEDILIHLLSHLEPAELGHASATCTFWRLAARQVMLSSSWLSRILGACGMRLQVAGALGMTIDVDYAALEPFYEGQPSGTGLRCLRAVATSEVVVQYAGIALPAHPSVATYALGLEMTDVQSAVMKIPHDDLSSVVVHPAAAESLHKWVLEESLGPHGLDSNRCCDAFVINLYRELPRALDARVFGNVSRFIKDETEAPNCAIGWTTESILAGQPHAYVVALQDIAAGVELSMDYGKYYDRHWLRPLGEAYRWPHQMTEAQERAWDEARAAAAASDESDGYGSGESREF